MAEHFITNEKQLLSEVMEGVFPYADKLHFLVGFFYFSGFEVKWKPPPILRYSLLIAM